MAECDECGSEFNLLDQEQANNYAFGHDCEVGE
jgi:hypothetical protein